jgi:hypothetical protein
MRINFVKNKHNADVNNIQFTILNEKIDAYEVGLDSHKV